LRDGLRSHRFQAVHTGCNAPRRNACLRHQYSLDHIRAIASALDEARVDAIEVSHGDGLKGSSFNYGFGAHTDWEWIEAVADVVKHSVLTTLLIPGIGTVEDLKQAYRLGVRSVRIATHCTEADISRQHIAAARDLGMDTAGFLMMSHMIEPEALAKQALLMEDYAPSVSTSRIVVALWTWTASGSATRLMIEC